MFKRKLAKVIVSLLRQLTGVSRAGAKRLMRAMLRALMAMSRRAQLPVAGFVLPTVTMVLLVVILLTLAITLRSFDRANNARNVRVNQQVLAAATPALDRAKAKIEYLLTEDPSRPTGTPSDSAINRVLSTPKPTTSDPNPVDVYTFDDETRLKVRFKLDRTGLSGWDATANVPENQEEVTTAWRFPVDTDNNGKFDSYTLYGVFFRSPPRDASGEFLTDRKPLEARTPPMKGVAGQICGAEGIVGDSGWYKTEGKLKKSFFVYTATVPITGTLPATIDQGEFELHKGTKAFSALEYQQDATRIPLLNNAVVYEDDLEISPGANFTLNGAMLTNSNLLVTTTNNGVSLQFYLMTNRNNPCFYQVENSKIRVAGNVVNGWSGGDTFTNVPVQVDLFSKSAATPASQNIEGDAGGVQSVANRALETLYNNKAYADRLSTLVTNQKTADPTGANDPLEVRAAIQKGTASRDFALEAYFKKITRKVPFIEVDTTTPDSINLAVEGQGNALRPQEDQVMLPSGNATEGDVNEYTGLTNQPAQLPATKPPASGQLSEEQQLGDRVLVGNNLPLKWWDDAKKAFVTSAQKVQNGTWADGSGDRTRSTYRQNLADAGAIGRDLFWEQAAAQEPSSVLSGTGGIRIITGAGVYERRNSFLPPPWLAASGGQTAIGTYDDPATSGVETYPVVWPDSMPMSPAADSKVYNNQNPAAAPAPGNTARWTDLPKSAWDTLGNNAGTPDTSSIDPNTPQYAKGDLRMRATVVYHYAQSAYDPNPDPVDFTQQPIACVSSYHDNSYRYTTDGGTTWLNSSLNLPALPWNTTLTNESGGRSNNGIVYPPPDIADRPTAAAFPGADGLFPGGVEGATTTLEQLYYQANIVFPDGRFANAPLRQALINLANGKSLSLADQSAIDSTLCSFSILNGATPTESISVPGGGTVTLKHGWIKEAAFLDARQIKAIDADNTATRGVDETFTLSSPLTSSGGKDPAQLTGQYDLSVEERMPLEVRVTQIDFDQLRNQDIDLAASIEGPEPEYLLPNSGIVYASREDAIPDRSDRTEADAGNVPTSADGKPPYGINTVKTEIVSRTDSRLDPSRRTSGIMVINTTFIARNDADGDGQGPAANTVADVVKEKGLTLVSDVPVYLKAPSGNRFNPHSKTEFTSNSGGFYGRNGLDKTYGCRLGDPRIAECASDGDTWRGVNILSDSLTLLSSGFREGFRNEGDFDLRNNAGVARVGYDFDSNDSIEPSATRNEPDLGIDLNGDGDITDTNVPEWEVTAKAARQLNGFLNNNYVTNGLSSGQRFFNNDLATYNPRDLDYWTTGALSTPLLNSSFFNNFVTPVQRRAGFGEYVMEMCRKLPISACGPSDWTIGYDDEGDGLNIGSTGNPAKINAAPLGPTTNEVDIRTYQLATALNGANLNATRLGAGTTALPATNAHHRRFPRRVAFLRNPSSGYTLVLAGGYPIPLGIASSSRFASTPQSSGRLKYYTYTGTPDTTSFTVSGITSTITAQSNDANGYMNLSTSAGNNFNRPRITTYSYNTLWFRTINNIATNPTVSTNWGFIRDQALAYRTQSVVPMPTTGDTVQYPNANSRLKHPLLVPVLQFQITAGPKADNSLDANPPITLPVIPGGTPPAVGTLVQNTRWIPRVAADTEYNLVLGGGDTPSRQLASGEGETNGGMQNLPRFLENWFGRNTTISGSFIQLNRSAFATAPYQFLFGATPVNGGVYGQPQTYLSANNAISGSFGRTPFFMPPGRTWGYDVALQTQSPDLFTQNFTTPPSKPTPDEYYREVGKNDSWVRTLMCSVVESSGDAAVSDDQQPDCNALTGYTP